MLALRAYHTIRHPDTYLHLSEVKHMMVKCLTSKQCPGRAAARTTAVAATQTATLTLSAAVYNSLFMGILQYNNLYMNIALRRFLHNHGRDFIANDFKGSL